MEEDIDLTIHDYIYLYIKYDNVTCEWNRKIPFNSLGDTREYLDLEERIKKKHDILCNYKNTQYITDHLTYNLTHYYKAYSEVTECILKYVIEDLKGIQKSKKIILRTVIMTNRRMGMIKQKEIMDIVLDYVTDGCYSQKIV
jgi:hypothetical protein